jgi:hypothetical protein
MDTTGSFQIYGIASDGRLNRGYSSLNIISTSTAIPIVEKIPDFRFYPNPAGDYIIVELPAADL